MPYEGPEPYVFVSYAHANNDKVYPVIKRLHEMGYRMWYDEGIEAGDKWFKVLSDHLRRSACMLLFWSPEAEKSQWVDKEILIALKNEIRIVGSVIIRTAIPDVLVDVQMLFRENFDSDEAFLDKLCKGLLAEKTKGPEPKPASSPVLEASRKEGWECKVRNDGTRIKDYWGNKSVVEVPNLYRGNQITVIGERAFRPKEVDEEGNAIDKLIHVIILEGIQKIKKGAFRGCKNLTDVTLPASVEAIAEDVFWDNEGDYRRLTFHCSRENRIAIEFATEHKFNIQYTDQEVLV